MRKRTFISIIIISVLFLSCSQKVNDYYSGFVVDEFGKPIADVLIEENTESNPLKTHTNKSGFFKLNRIEGIICNLRLMKNGYKSDTISTFKIRYESTGTDGDTEYLSLLTSDTTKIILQKQSNDFYNAKDLLVSEIKDIKEIPYIQNCNDEIFWNLVKQGKKNIPDLINKLTDKTVLKEVYVPMFGGEYTVADASLVILNEKIKGIPIFELIGQKFSEECGYCAYWYYVREKTENRIHLQNNLKKWYEENENKLVWVESNSSLTGDCFSPAKGHYEIKK
ncbi:carboxypeptidase-like regulatory domain-containing protein [Flavobacterium panacagri]|uniref:carboxypeptidase-like regulatory domain-containing protein n=1 Tax=Flavobacterium panacagri TaxID=3034146 RepID=UPI0025A5274E|nr:carboxypeptidase-like regulatory domain-containing protein [Flavobacterium panacagri]